MEQEPIGYVREGVLEALRAGPEYIDRYLIQREQKDGFTVPLYAAPPVRMPEFAQVEVEEALRNGPMHLVVKREDQCWRPIESASRDEPILISKWHDGELYWIASGYLSVEAAEIWRCDVHDRELVFSPSASFYQPTHWMPLPPAPQEPTL